MMVFQAPGMNAAGAAAGNDAVSENRAVAAADHGLRRRYRSQVMFGPLAR